MKEYELIGGQGGQRQRAPVRAWSRLAVWQVNVSCLGVMHLRISASRQSAVRVALNSHSSTPADTAHGPTVCALYTPCDALATVMHGWSTTATADTKEKTDNGRGAPETNHSTLAPNEGSNKYASG